jgi:hypothetical protein
MRVPSPRRHDQDMALLVLLVAVALVALALAPVRSASLAWVAAAVNIAFAGLLTSYVLRTAYNGRRTWDLRVDSGEHRLYFAAMGVVAFSVAVFGLLALRRTRYSLVRGAMLASGCLDFVLGWLVFIAFELD